MLVSEILSLISEAAKESGTSTPFIVGGMPRDKMLENLNEVQDIDITTGDESIYKLVNAVHKKLPETVSIKTFPDSHAQIVVDSIKIDFSSNFVAVQVPELLKKAKIAASSMIVELLSRDFTCNSLLMELDLKTIKDPIGMAINDIKARILKTPIEPSYTLSNDPKRIVRIIYLSTKLDFDVEPQIIDFVSKNPELIKSVKPKYISDKLSYSMSRNEERTVELINKMKLWPHIPITGRLVNYYRGQ